MPSAKDLEIQKPQLFYEIYCICGAVQYPMITKNQMMSALSNFSTAYNLTIISLVLVVSNGVYHETDSQKASIKSAALAGAIMGQLTMGYYADAAGRSAAMFLTMMLTLVGALASSLNMQDIWGSSCKNLYNAIRTCQSLLSCAWSKHSYEGT